MPSEHDGRDALRRAPADHLETVDARHLDIEEQDVGRRNSERRRTTRTKATSTTCSATGSSQATTANMTEDLARESGFRSAADLLRVAKLGGEEHLYLIRFHSTVGNTSSPSRAVRACVSRAAV
jgi:hypothetical protein